MNDAIFIDIFLFIIAAGIGAIVVLCALIFGVEIAAAVVGSVLGGCLGMCALRFFR